ncbi:MAG: hypothetical protein IKA05_05085 [Clostridia bacterium]|nr:hypothetical protein [Clostridia bacterium]
MTIREKTVQKREKTLIFEVFSRFFGSFFARFFLFAPFSPDHDCVFGVEIRKENCGN